MRWTAGACSSADSRSQALPRRPSQQLPRAIPALFHHNHSSHQRIAPTEEYWGCGKNFGNPAPRGAERAEITVERELAKIGFSDIRKAVSCRNEMVAREEEGEREDGVVRVTRVLLPRVSIVPSEEMDPDIAAAITQIWQGPNGEVRVRLHDKHAALISIGRHLGMFRDTVKIDAVYSISEEPMSAEERNKLYVTECVMACILAKLVF